MTLPPLEYFSGTEANVTLHVSAQTINELLRLSGTSAGAATIELRANNEVVVRYGMIHATLTLPDELECGPAPRVTVTLASLVVALALRAAVRQPFVAISGRQMTIDLANVPALSAARPYFRHLRRVTLTTSPGAVEINAVIHVDEHVTS